MPLLNRQRNCLIEIIKLNKFNSPILSLKNLSTNSSSIVTDSSTRNNNLFVNQQDASYQFNDQLIKRIKKSKLFKSEFKNIKGDNEEKLELSSGVLKYIPSVTKIISETMTEENIKVLEIWKAKMIKKLGVSGFQKYQQDIFSRGKRLHKNIECKLKHDDENIKVDEDIAGYWNSLQPVLNEIKEVHLIEEKLTHPNLLYKGIVDCVARFNQVSTVVDWKTSEKVKDSLAKLYDAPVQCVAYLGALNNCKLLDFELDKIAIVVAYNNGRIANYHQIKEKDCNNFWDKWTDKVEDYWVKSLSSAPADPCLLSHFDNLCLLKEDKNKKLYFLNENSLKKNKKVPNEIQSKKKYKTKDELVNLLKKSKVD